MRKTVKAGHRRIGRCPCKVTPTPALTRTLLVALTRTPALTLTLTLLLPQINATHAGRADFLEHFIRVHRAQSTHPIPPHISTHLPTSPHTFPYLPISPLSPMNLPYVSPTSPYTSQVTTAQRGESAHASSIGDFAPIRAAISRSADL